jgi:hypothetical protein
MTADPRYEATPIGQLGGNVTVIIPNSRIASRWNGALRARLRQAPLEAYLRSHGQKWALAGETRLTDNLACATIYIVSAALAQCAQEHRPLTAPQHPAVGQIACTVSSSLALLIQEPTQWRSAALVATARLLEKHVGLSAAAHAAAASAREFGAALNNGCLDAEVLRIGNAARGAVESNADADTMSAVRSIAERLSSMSPLASGAPVDAAPAHDGAGAIVGLST